MGRLQAKTQTTLSQNFDWPLLRHRELDIQTSTGVERVGRKERSAVEVKVWRWWWRCAVPAAPVDADNHPMLYKRWPTRLWLPDLREWMALGIFHSWYTLFGLWRYFSGELHFSSHLRE